MAVQQVEHGAADRGSIRRHQAIENFGEARSVERDQVPAKPAVLANGRAVEMRPGGEPNDRAQQRIVHQPVVGAAIEQVRAFVPDLGEDVRISIHGPHPAAKLLPEARCLDLGGDVEPPTIGSEARPVLGGLEEVLAHLGVVRVELGERREVPPGAIAQRRQRLPTCGMRQGPISLERLRARFFGVGPQLAPRGEPIGVEDEPIDVRRRCAVLHDVVERPQSAAGVVEDAIQDQPHAALVYRVDQLAQRFVAAQQRIHPPVVVGVVPMIRGRGEDRVQADGVDPQVDQVVEMLGDPQQVAALEAVPRRRIVPRLQVTGLVYARAPRESVREDLVDDRVSYPRRGIVVGGYQGSPILDRRPAPGGRSLGCGHE